MTDASGQRCGPDENGMVVDPMSQRCGNCLWWDGKHRIGTCTWDAPIPVWAQADMGGVLREMHAIHGKECETWQPK